MKEEGKGMRLAFGVFSGLSSEQVAERPQLLLERADRVKGSPLRPRDQVRLAKLVQPLVPEQRQYIIDTLNTVIYIRDNPPLPPYTAPKPLYISILNGDDWLLLENGIIFTEAQNTAYINRALSEIVDVIQGYEQILGCNNKLQKSALGLVVGLGRAK